MILRANIIAAYPKIGKGLLLCSALDEQHLALTVEDDCSCSEDVILWILLQIFLFIDLVLLQ